MACRFIVTSAPARLNTTAAGEAWRSSVAPSTATRFGPASAPRAVFSSGASARSEVRAATRLIVASRLLVSSSRIRPASPLAFSFSWVICTVGAATVVVKPDVPAGVTTSVPAIVTLAADTPIVVVPAGTSAPPCGREEGDEGEPDDGNRRVAAHGGSSE